MPARITDYVPSDSDVGGLFDDKNRAKRIYKDGKKEAAAKQQQQAALAAAASAAAAAATPSTAAARVEAGAAVSATEVAVAAK